MTNRWTLYPIKHPKLWSLYQLHKSTLWHAEDIDYSADLKDLALLTPEMLHYLKMVLGFFAASDGIVNENLAIRAYSDTVIPEARAFYALQMFMETEHAECYSLLIDTFIKDEDEKAKLFNAIENYATIKRKADWAVKWMNSQESVAKRRFAFAIVEGVFFSGSFCAIYWFKELKLFEKSLAKANDYIARDETLHWQFQAAIFLEEKNRIDQEEANQMLREAVEIECDFIKDSLPFSMIGMNADLMCQYIRHVADKVSNEFGLRQIYGDANPFDFMKKLGLDGQKNFFEKRPNEYIKSTADQKISFDEEF